MQKLFEMKGYLTKYYAKYSKIVDKTIQFVLALLTFTYINQNIGFSDIIANPYSANNLCSCTNKYIVADNRSPRMLCLRKCIRTNSNLMKNSTISSNLCAAGNENAVISMRKSGLISKVSIKRNKSAKPSKYFVPLINVNVTYR